MNLIIIILFAVLNALRGSGFIDRCACAFGMGISVLVFSAYQNLSDLTLISLMIFTGMWLGLVWGWGKYLNIFSGNLAYVNEVEVAPIDWIVTKICGKPATEKAFVFWCFLAMTLRGLLFYPVFVGLSFYKLDALLYGLGCVLMGFVYFVARIAPVRWQVRTGEFLYGGLLGLLISSSV